MPFRRLRRIAAFASTAGLALALAAAIPRPAAAQQQEAPLTIATKEAPPFAMRSSEGEWRGLSIDLWERIAGDLGLEYRLEAVPLNRMIAGTGRGDYDAAVAALTVTRERERTVDFSHPFHTTGFAIAVSGEAGWLRGLLNLFSGPFLSAVAALAAVLLIAGTAMWLFERRRNREQFGGKWHEGIGAGFWWSAVTMTTVGYGDKAPVTLGGRIVALVWMFASIIIISGFTAAIASAITIGSLSQDIRGPNDLEGVTVATVPGSTAAEWLAGRGISYTENQDLAAALDALAQGEAGAVVYDAPILRWAVMRREGKALKVLENTFQRQDYAIALPEGSPLREDINRRLLAVIQSPEWEQIKQRYLGDGG